MICIIVAENEELEAMKELMTDVSTEEKINSLFFVGKINN